MIRRIIRCLLLTALLYTLLSTQAFSHTPVEHRELADTILARVFGAGELTSALFKPSDMILGTLTFADIAALDSLADRTPAHCQEQGKTILEQLNEIDSAMLANRLAEFLDSTKTVRRWRNAGYFLTDHHYLAGNTAANYLLLHLAALHFADRAAAGGNDRENNFRLAMVYEAGAQHFLADAFSSGHILIPVHAAGAGLFPVNITKQHDRFSREGTFVVNGLHQLWKTYGDNLLSWYPESYHHIVHACMTSLREVITVYLARATGPPLVSMDNLSAWYGKAVGKDTVAQWLAIRNGGDYFASRILPSLLELPMPVSAVWGIRTDSLQHFTIVRTRKDTTRTVDAQIIRDTLVSIEPSFLPHVVSYYPQLAECTDLTFTGEEADSRYVYASNAVPDFMRLGAMHGGSNSADAAIAIRTDTALASMHFTQTRDPFPAFDGMLFTATYGIGASRQFSSVGTGYAWSFGVYLAGSVVRFNDDPISVMAVPAVGIRLPVGEIMNSRWWPSVRLEGGMGIGMNSPSPGNGAHVAVGLDWFDYEESPIVHFPGMPFAITPELRYEYFGQGLGWHSGGVTLIIH